MREILQSVNQAIGRIKILNLSRISVLICERLIDAANDMPVAVNRYFGKEGQYSESWNKAQTKKNDALLRIIRILHKI